MTILWRKDPRPLHHLKAHTHTLGLVAQTPSLALPLQTDTTRARYLANEHRLSPKRIGSLDVKDRRGVGALDREQGGKDQRSGLQAKPRDFVVLALQKSYLF